jgi:small subunit ribosomal protein S18
MGFKKMRPRKKVCYFKKNHIKYVDYKDVELLQRFVLPMARSLRVAQTGTSAKYQRELAKRRQERSLHGFTPGSRAK